ncbi:MAG: hypothetical protein ACI8W7_002834 [Gammaproteobacteria bacterium]|jgi:hypothetical protein
MTSGFGAQQSMMATRISQPFLAPFQTRHAPPRHTAHPRNEVVLMQPSVRSGEAHQPTALT